jgi:hypothetical protein
MVKKYSRKKKYKKGGSVQTLNIPPFGTPMSLSQLLENMLSGDLQELIADAEDYVLSPIQAPNLDNIEFDKINEIYEIIGRIFGVEILNLFKTEMYSFPFDIKDMNYANNTNIYFSDKPVSSENITKNDYMNDFKKKCIEIARKLNQLRDGPSSGPNTSSNTNKKDSNEKMVMSEENKIISTDEEENKFISTEDKDEDKENNNSLSSTNNGPSSTNNGPSSTNIEPSSNNDEKKYKESLHKIFLINPDLIKDANIIQFFDILEIVFTKNIDYIFLKYKKEKEEYAKFVKTLQDKVKEVTKEEEVAKEGAATEEVKNVGKKKEIKKNKNKISLSK